MKNPESWGPTFGVQFKRLAFLFDFETGYESWRFANTWFLFPSEGAPSYWKATTLLPIRRFTQEPGAQLHKLLRGVPLHQMLAPIKDIQIEPGIFLFRQRRPVAR
jgi:hypothetical protein